MRGDEVGLAAQPSAKPEPTWAGVIVGAVFFLIGLVACAATGLAAAAMSESDAVAVSYAGVPLALGGVVALATAGLVRTQSPPVAIGAPLGCGCGTFVAGVVGMIVFFTVLWPAL